MGKKTIIVKTQRQADEERAWGGVFFIVGLFIFAGIFGTIFQNFIDKPEMAGATGFCIAIVPFDVQQNSTLIIVCISWSCFYRWGFVCMS